MRSSVLSAFRPEDLDAWVANVVAAGGRMGATDRLFAQVLADVARRRWSMSTTLSAGINMPARTTVICSLAKCSDLGMFFNFQLRLRKPHHSLALITRSPL